MYTTYGTFPFWMQNLEQQITKNIYNSCIYNHYRKETNKPREIPFICLVKKYCAAKKDPRCYGIMRIKVHLEWIYEEGLAWFMMTMPHRTPPTPPHFLTESYKNILKMRFAHWKT